MPAKKRKGPGRPAIKNPRSVLVAFRLTRGEARALRAAARAAGLSLTGYTLRRLKLKG
jgi:uncharacterized protein (DUF1778 family)